MPVTQNIVLSYLFTYLCCFIETYYLETEEDPIKFLHASFGRIITHVAYLNSTIFSYGIAAAFDNQTSSDSCAVIFVDNVGYPIAATKFMNRYVLGLSDSIDSMIYRDSKLLSISR